MLHIHSTEGEAQPARSRQPRRHVAARQNRRRVWQKKVARKAVAQREGGGGECDMVREVKVKSAGQVKRAAGRARCRYGARRRVQEHVGMFEQQVVLVSAWLNLESIQVGEGETGTRRGTVGKPSTAVCSVLF